MARRRFCDPCCLGCPAAWVQYLESAPLEWLLEVNRFVLVFSQVFGALGTLMGAAGLVYVPGALYRDQALVLLVFVFVLFCFGAVVTFGTHRLHLHSNTIWFAGAGWTLATVGLQIPAPFFGDAIYRHRTIAGSMILWKTIIAFLGAPPIPSAVYILITVAVDIAAHYQCQVFWGEQFTPRMVVASCTYGIMSFVFVCVNSRRLKDCYDYQQEIAAQKCAMEALLDMICDFTLWLSQTGETVMESCGRIDLFLDKSLKGDRLLSHLHDTGGEQERLAEALSLAGQSPVLLPITLLSKNGGQHAADAFIVKRRQALTEASSGFLIGLRLATGDANQPAELPATSYSSGVSRRHLPVGGPRREQAFDVISIDHPQSAGGPLSSAASSTPTGRVFSDIAEGMMKSGDEVLALAPRLEAVVEMGEQEHWLLASAALQLVPERIVGKGGFGIVIAGLFRGAPVAVKVAQQSRHSTSASSLVSICNELRILRQVRHPAVIAFHGAVVDPSSAELALVMELAAGCSVREFVGESPGIADRLCVLLDVASPLAYLHHNQPTIIHGDLKASNVIVGSTNNRVCAKLLDFGLSRVLTSHRRPLGGTPQWMAPEVVMRPQAKPTVRADVFSFGRLLYLVLTGLDPLKGIDPALIVDMLRRGFLPNLSWQEGPLCAEGKGLSDACVNVEPTLRPDMLDVHARILAWRHPDLTPRVMAGPPWWGGLADAKRTWAGALREARQQCRSSKVKSECKQRGRRSSDWRRTQNRSSQFRSVPLASVSEHAEPSGNRPILPTLHVTSDEARLRMLMEILMRWNCHLPPDSCCAWHGVLGVCDSLLSRARNMACMPVFYESTGHVLHQCPHCGVLPHPSDERIDEFNVDGADKLCDVCGEKFRSAKRSSASLKL